jgi:cytochrome c oxidase subunit 2
MDELLGNYRVGLPVAASTYAGRVDTSLTVLHVGMVAIFLLWLAFFVYCLWRFQQKKVDRASYQGWKGHASSFVPDALVLVFELWLIFVFGLPIWSHIKQDFPAEDASNVVGLSAEQFSWGFHYPGPDGKLGRRDPARVTVSNPLGLDDTDPAAADDLVLYNELHVPLGKPTILQMTSKDVIHSFFVPEFRVKQDVVPGMKIPLWFEPNRVGRFEIGCAQLCGAGHYVMRGEIVVQTPEEYAQWWAGVSQAKAAAKPKVVAASDWSE